MPLIGRERLSTAIADSISELNDGLRGIYLSGLGNIVSLTPADKGRARNNWFLTVSSPSTRTTTSASIGGGGSLSQAAKLPKMVLGKKIYFTNNLPYIGVLEYGGYPNPVAKGSYIIESKDYQVLSANGYSKQAPNGMARISLIKMQNKIRSL